MSSLYAHIPCLNFGELKLQKEPPNMITKGLSQVFGEVAPTRQFLAGCPPPDDASTSATHANVRPPNRLSKKMLKMVAMTMAMAMAMTMAMATTC